MPRTRRAGIRRTAGFLRLGHTESSRQLRLQSEHLEARHLLTVSVAPAQLVAPEGFLTGPSDRPTLEIVDAFLRDHAADLGATADDLTSYRITDLYSDDHNGVTHVYLRQQLNGLDVLGADLNVNLMSDGRILNAGASFLNGLVAQADTFDAVPELTSLNAVQSAAKELGYALGKAPELTGQPVPDYFQASTMVTAPGLSLDDIPVGLAWAPVAGGVELAWSMVVRTPDGDHWYDLAVSADSGEILWDNDWTEAASYSALPLPVDSPKDGNFEILTDINDPVASPFGWHDTNGVAGAESTFTIGNNVSAQEDQDNNNQANNTNRVDGGANLQFLATYGANNSLAQNLNASITNLFVFNNLLHDVLYQYGFNEVSGNFQTNTYGRGGTGNDAVQADSLDGSGTDNANFSTPPDGISGRMQMYKWRVGNKWYDSSFDNGIIAHEYGHGLSTRLTGGPANSNSLRNLQSGGMGEGWSDWLALMLTQRPTDQKMDSFGVGTYVLGQNPNGNGIRRYPYSFDMEINPLTLGRFNSSNEVHDAGEIWASTLWDLNWLLIDKYGYDADIYHGDGGNNLMMQLVLDGMKLQPSNPSFLQARDAILAADRALTGGDNQIVIWTAFARRGMGFYAQDGGSTSTSVVESFVVPDLGLHVVTSTPADGAIVTSPTSDFTIELEADVNPTSVAASDFLLNGVAADSVMLLNSKTLKFHYNNSPAAVEGVFTMTLAGDSLTRASDGDGLTPFSATFRYDTVQLAATAIRPASGQIVTLPLTAIEVDFNEPVGAASLDPSNLSVNLGSVVSAELVDADTVRYFVSGIDREATMLVALRGGSVKDLSGNPTLGALANYTLDSDTLPLPELSAYPLAGSMVYHGSYSGILGTEGDVDLATFTLAAGQQVSVMVNPSPDLAAKVDLWGPGGVLLGTTTSGTGSDGVLSALTAGSAGVYTIAISQTEFGLGEYRVEVLLNAAPEDESSDGSANDTPASAQDLNGAFAPLPLGGDRAAVVGFADLPAVALSNEIEPNGVISQATVAVADFAPIGSTQRFQQSTTGQLSSGNDVDWFYLGQLDNGDNLTVSALGAGSSRGTHADTYLELWRVNGGSPVRVAKDDNAGSDKDALLYRSGITANDEYFLRVSSGDGIQTGTYVLSAWLEDFGADPPSGSPVASESENNNAMDSATNISRGWSKVGYYSRIDGQLDYNDRDVYQVLLSAGDTLTVFAETSLLDMGVRVFDSTGALVAQEDGTSTGATNNSWVYAFNAPTSGLYYVEYRTVAIRTGSYKAQMYLSSDHDPPAPTNGDDFYRIGLAAGERISLAATTLEFGSVQIEITDASGSVLRTAASGSTSTLDDWQAPTAGDYLVRVRGLGPYNLVATREAGFDSHDNDTLATSQRLAVSGDVLGGIESGDADVFHFIAAAGQAVQITTATPGGLANVLDPRIEIYDPSGALVASDDNSAGDGRNAALSFTPASGGNYRVRVVGAGSSTGEYELSVDGHIALASVRDVVLGSTGGTHDDYTIPGGSGEQLRTPAVGAADRVSLAFTEDVVVGQNDLTLFGAHLGGNYSATGFSYDAVNHVATWTFAPFNAAEEFTLTLSDSVHGLLSGALDGEWVNPSSLSDNLSSSGAGNGLPGGAFVFRFNVLPGDANRDNHVTGADFTIWSDQFGLHPGSAAFEQGDFNGDGFVTGADFTIWSDNFGVSQTAGLAPVVDPESTLPTAITVPTTNRTTTLAPPTLSTQTAVVPESAIPVSKSVEIRGLKRKAIEQNVAEIGDWRFDEAIGALAANSARRPRVRHN